MTSTAPQRLRLVLRSVENEGGRAYLYPADSSVFTAPVASFALSHDQPIPGQEPGDFVDVSGPLQRPDRVVAGDGTELAVKGEVDVSPSVVPIFAERGGVITHPDISGHAPSWRHVHSASHGDLPTWQRRIRAKLRAAAVVLALVVLTVGWIVFSLLTGRDLPRFRGYHTALAAGAVIAAGRLALQSLRALREAQDVQGAGRPMLMELWWSVGYGQGPVAMATLFECDRDSGPIAHVPVIGVPPGFTTAERVPVDVRGDPAGAPTIDVAGRILWPAHHARPIQT